MADSALAGLALAGAAVLAVLMAVCGLATARRSRLAGLPLLQMVNVLGLGALLLAAYGFGEGFLAETAVVLAVLSLPGTEIYAHFFARWR